MGGVCEWAASGWAQQEDLVAGVLKTLPRKVEGRRPQGQRAGTEDRLPGEGQERRRVWLWLQCSGGWEEVRHV